ncbi:MAG: hypothetical protein QOJ58_3859 [Alphaproteobacteria bacterium]|nr:hypothetical protein [Alphaproteobacteria bacterium]MEA2963763.1 hypothetical protein [Alphaproteobacteria bacterium]
MVAIKDPGATRRGAGKSAPPPPIRSRNLGKTSRRSASTPAVGTRPSRLGSGRSPPSTLLRVSRTVGDRARWQDTPTAEEVQGIVRRPGHKDIVRLPAGMSSDVGGRERPDHLIVEMARVPGIALRLTLANSSAIARVRRPNLKGLWGAPWRCHRSGSYFVRPCLHRQRASAEAGPPGQAGPSGTKYSTWGRGYPRKHEAGAGGEMEGR